MIIRKMLETDTVLKLCKIIATGIAKDYHRSQDIMQQAFLLLLQNAKKYDDIECPEDFYKLFWKLCKRENDRLIYRLDQQVAYEDLTAVDHVSDIETEDMINALPEKLCSVARYLLNGYTVAEIADKLDVSDRYVRTLRQQLRTALTKERNSDMKRTQKIQQHLTTTREDMIKIVDLASQELTSDNDRVFLDSRSSQYTYGEIDVILKVWRFHARSAGFRVILDYDSATIIDHDNDRMIKRGGLYRFYLVSNDFPGLPGVNAGAPIPDLSRGRHADIGRDAASMRLHVQAAAI